MCPGVEAEGITDKADKAGRRGFVKLAPVFEVFVTGGG